jgi:predicted nucleic acid-binding protein
MSDKAFVDTNILVYAYDQSAREKQVTAQDLLKQLWMQKRGVVSSQVLQEFCVNVRRKFLRPLSVEQVREVISAYREWQLIVSSAESILRALEMEERYQLSFWDAMIVQAAANGGCQVLYSEDLSHGQEYDGVLVVNPFEAGKAGK